jgi:hypothetical protein
VLLEDPIACQLGHPPSRVVRLKHLHHGPRQGRRVARLDQSPGHAILDGRRHHADRGGDHWHRCRHSLQRCVRTTLYERRQYKEVHRIQIIWDRRFRHPARKNHASGESQLCGERLILFHMSIAAAHCNESQPAVVAGGGEDRRHFDELLRSLRWAEVGDIADQDLVRGDSQARPHRTSVSSRGEWPQVETVRDDCQFARISADP